tara:strand:- start:13 stop:285 length:273 start_codon:yes stop_codon:yes gene_type:complete
MKKNKKFKLINNINKETQLLESLGWDETTLKDLYEYLDIHFSGDSIISPKILLQEIKEKFGEDCSKILQGIFLEVSLTHGLFIHDPNIEN